MSGLTRQLARDLSGGDLDRRTHEALEESPIGTKQTGLNRAQLLAILNFQAGSGVLDFASIAAGADAEMTISASGVIAGQPVMPGWPDAILTTSGLEGMMWATTDTVHVKLTNNSAGAIDPASATYSFLVDNG